MKRLVYISITGPDPKRIKAGSAASASQPQAGRTTLSSSGFILGYAPTECFVLTSLVSLLPFLQQDARTTLPRVGSDAASPSHALLPAVQIKCFFTNGTHAVAEFLGTYEVPGMVNALQRLLDAPAATIWSLGSRPSATAVTAGHLAVMRIALPRTSAAAAVTAHIKGHHVVIASASMHQPGSCIAAFGAPFGAMVGSQFLGFQSRGIIAATQCDCRDSEGVILSDMQSLPGMEGGPVVLCAGGPSDGCGDESCVLLGLLTAPLHAPTMQAQASVILPAASVVEAGMQVLHKLGIGTNIWTGIGTTACTTDGRSALDVRKQPRLDVIASTLLGVVGVQCDTGSWASGVLVTVHGHVLTNAHAVGGNHHQKTVPLKSGRLPEMKYNNSRVKSLQPPPANSMPLSRCHVCMQSKSGSTTWHPAQLLHVFPPPIDLAVLQIDSSRMPTQGLPELPHTRHPPSNRSVCDATARIELEGDIRAATGSPVLVAGHPLWRPGSLASPFVGPFLTSGHVAHIISAPLEAKTPKQIPAALLTSAAVHAGASGGAVLDAVTGRLLGLVTSNTRVASISPVHDHRAAATTANRHNAATFPNVNYSIPASVLLPLVRALEEATRANNLVSRKQIEGPAAGVAIDWNGVEREMLDGNGVVHVWEQLHALQPHVDDGDGDGMLPETAPVPPALAILLQKMQESDRGALPRSKL